MSEETFTIEEVTDPVEDTRFRAQHAQFKSNTDWLQSHWNDLLPKALGKCLAVACQEAFLADTPEEAWRLAKAAHPEDNGTLFQYVLPHQGPRIYAHRR
jgi:hypothetical protein